MYILIMNPEWGEMILKGEKTWEVRRSATNHIERIKIAYSKTKKSFGEVNLVKCIPLTKDLFEKNVDKHCIHDSWEQVTARYPNPVVKHLQYIYAHTFIILPFWLVLFAPRIKSEKKL